MLTKYHPDVKPGFTSMRGYANATLWVEGLKRAGKNLTREDFADALEGIHDWDQGLGKGMELSYSKTNHLGRNKVFYGEIKDGQVVNFDNWKSLKSRVKI